MARSDAEHYEACPSVESLSAWHDSELRDRAMEDHVATCDRCLKVIQSFHMIDTRVVETVQLDTHALCRIKCRTRREIQQRPMVRELRAALRIAALLAIVTGVGVLSVRSYRKADAKSEGLAAANRAITPMSATSVAQTESEASPATAVVSERLRPAVSSLPVSIMSSEPPRTGNVKLASTDEMTFRRESRLQNACPIVQMTQKQALNDTVRHVWLVDDVADPLQELKGLLPDANQQFDHMLETKQAQYTLEMHMDDRNLARLVDHFHELGYSLLSPDAPQPDTSAMTLFSGKTVTYELNLIQK